MSFCLSLRFSRVLLLQSARKWKTINWTSIRLCCLALLFVSKRRWKVEYRDSVEYKHSPLLLPDYSILSHLYSGLFWDQFFPGILIDERLRACVIGDHLLSIGGYVDDFRLVPSSETAQGQSVGSGERAGRTFSSTGKRAPWYRLSPSYFQKFKWVPAPDWAQKMLCIIVPNRRTVSPELFSWVRSRRLLSRHTWPFRSSSLCVQGELLFSTFLTRNEGTTDESKKTFGMLSARANQFAPRIFCFWRITMYRK